jgi:hypothetical protein
MSYLRYLCLFSCKGVQRILCCAFLRLVCPMSPISVDCPFWLPLWYSLLTFILVGFFQYSWIVLSHIYFVSFCPMYASFYDFLIWLLNCSKGVVFVWGFFQFFFHYYWSLLSTIQLCYVVQAITVHIYAWIILFSSELAYWIT